MAECATERVIGRKMGGMKMGCVKIAAVVRARWRSDRGRERAVPQVIRIGTARSENRAIAFVRRLSFFSANRKKTGDFR